MKIFIVSLILLLLMVVTAQAFTVDMNGVHGTVTYDVPTSTVPIDHSTIYYCKQPVKLVVIPAVSNAGGFSVSQPVDIPLAPGEKTHISIFSTTTGLNGVESEPSNTATVEAEMKVRPPAPQ